MINQFSSSTSVGISVLWAYQYPHLLRKAVDDLFTEWGTLATFYLVPFTKGEMRVVAIRNSDDARTPMIEVIRQKGVILIGLDQWIDEFIAEYRIANAWIIQQYDAERSRNLGVVSA